MQPENIMVYRAYYQNQLLAVHHNKQILKSYLKHIRNLSAKQYHIENSYISSENISILYDQYYLDEYLKDLYLPRGDCDKLDKEVQNEFDYYVSTLDGLRYYYNQIKHINYLTHHAIQLSDTIKNMEEDLTTRKALKKLKKKIIQSSPLLSLDIVTYLNTNKITDECDALTLEYKSRLYSDD